MAAKMGRKVRPPRKNAPAALPALPRDTLPSNLSGERLVPALYGVFFVFLFLACSPVLDAKFSLPKSIVLGVGVFALCALIVVRSWRGRIAEPSRPVLFLSLALGGWWIAATPFALHLPTALAGEYDCYNGLWTHLCCLALFVASLSLPTDTPTARKIAIFLVLAIVPVAAINISETVGFTSIGLKEVSTLGDRVSAAALMNFAILFVVIALIGTRHWGIKAVLGGLLALLLISEFLSQGRGPWIGLVVAVVILAVGLTRSQARWKVIIPLALGLVVLAGLTAKLSPAVAQRLATLTHISQDAAVGQRFVYYRAALRAISEHPVTGIGFENFRNSYPHYRGADDINFFDGVIPTMVHNGYLETALSSGIPALMLYLALVATVLVRLVGALSPGTDRDRDDLLLGFLAALSAYLVQDLTGWLTLGLAPVFWIVLGLAMNQATQAPARPPGRSIRAIVATFAGSMVFLSAYLLVDGRARIVADVRLAAAQTLDAKTQWRDIQTLVEQALSSLPADSRTETVAGQLYGTRYLFSHDPKAYARSHELLESSYVHNPFERMRLINIVALELIALERGTIGSASEFAKNALVVLAETDRDNPAFHELKAKFFAAQGRFDEALAAIREARRLAPQESRFRSSEAEYLGAAR